MTEEEKKKMEEKKEETVSAKDEGKDLEKIVGDKSEAQEKTEDKKTEEKIKKEKADDKKEEKTKKKGKEESKPKKEEAVAKGVNVAISKKHSVYICNAIKGKRIDDAIKWLEEVIKMKRAVPFKGEIPHRKGMMSGRYPISASKEFISMLKALKGNVSVNGLELEKVRIDTASATWGRRPLRRGSRRAKRTNVILIARESKK